jgi:hypothetical protein
LRESALLLFLNIIIINNTTPLRKNLMQSPNLASYICHTPIALISFIDETTLWHKSAIEIDNLKSALTASVLDNDIEAINEAHMNGHILKPFVPTDRD